MTDEEVNKVIAEFMGWKYHAEHDPSPVFTHEIYSEKQSSYFKFTKSLDALVPVWKKLGWDKWCFEIHGRIEGFQQVNYMKEDTQLSFTTEKLTIQQAAAHATAKAIKELE